MHDSDVRNLVYQTLAAFGHDAAIPFFEKTWPQARGVRGVEFYGMLFPTVYRTAARNFFQFHKRLPDANALPLAADHLFFSKFFRPFPTKPNAASKLNAVKFLDQNRFAKKIYVPRRLFVSSVPALPDDLSSVSGWWLKLDLGNATHVKIDPESGTLNHKMLGERVKHWFKSPRYGLRWGEWWYAATPQRIFCEEDLTGRMPGDEYQFFMKSGRCVMFKKKRIFYSSNLEHQKIVAAFYDGAGNHVPGTQSSFSAPEDVSLSEHLDVMLEAAHQIAAAFDHIRVDFILLDDAPALGELTYCTMNARIVYSNEVLENLARDAVRMDTPKL